MCSREPTAPRRDTASYDYAADDYALSAPFLTGTDFTSLQGMDASKSFTFHFSPDVTGSNATASFIFFTIFDFTKNASVFNAGFLNPSTTSVTLAANTLTGGDLFGYELDFSNRDLVPSPGAVFQAQLGFDLRTDGTFRAAPAAVPEPSTLALLGVGSLVARISARRRKKS
jgi:PEP-CTERM motif